MPTGVCGTPRKGTRMWLHQKLHIMFTCDSVDACPDDCRDEPDANGSFFAAAASVIGSCRTAGAER
jgi:hypothetical protein